MMPQQPGVTVPPHLAGPLARLAVLGLAELSRRGGSPRTAPGIAALLAELDKSASGRPPATMEAPSRVTAGEAAQIAGTSARHMRRLAASGRLRARKAGRDWEIDADSARDYGRDRRRAGTDDTGRGQGNRPGRQ